MSTALHHEASDDQFARSGARSAEDLELLAERTAREMLGVSAAQAFRMLDNGELAGTLAESALESLRFILTS